MDLGCGLAVSSVEKRSEARTRSVHPLDHQYLFSCAAVISFCIIRVEAH